MADNVTRLKELLLTEEHHEIGQLAVKIEKLYDRAGTADRMRTSVAEVLDGAIREAEERQHTDLAAAVAPVVVAQIRTEISGSTDQIAEALVPRMGSMISSYIANAFNDYMTQINAKLESAFSWRRIKIKARSLVTGKPESELLLASMNHLKLDELYLIRRGSGELIERWEHVGVGTVAGRPVGKTGSPAMDPAARSNRDAVISGFLAAINEFAREAFATPNAGLQTLQMGDFRIFLRSSPQYLLAAKCSGAATLAVERVLDEEFLNILKIHRHAVTSNSNGNVTGSVNGPINDKGNQLNGHRSAGLETLLPELARNLDRRLSAADPSANRPAGGSRLLAKLAGVVAIVLLSWFAWERWRDWRTDTVRGAVVAQIDQSPLRNYPIQVEVERGGGAVRLKGIAPSSIEKDGLVEKIRGVLAWSTVDDSIEVLKDGVPRGDLQALRRELDEAASRMARGNIILALEQFDQRMARALQQLQRLGAEVRDAPQRAVVDRLIENLGALRARTRGLSGELAQATGNGEPAAATAQLQAIAVGLRPVVEKLAELRGETVRDDGPVTVGRATGTPERARHSVMLRDAEAASLLADQLGNEIAATERYYLLGTISALNERLSRASAVSPRQALEQAARANAVFFTNDLSYRDQPQAERSVTELARRLKETNAILRVVGYTDEKGNAQKNTTLALDRAEKVRQALIAAGAPAERLSVLGRTNGPNLSGAIGERSPNRRVEFEVGFDGENDPSGG